MEQLISIKSSVPARAINLTPTAIDKVRELVAEEGEPELALRMEVRAGGCSGFSYDMYFDSAVNELDVVEMFDDVRVVVDDQSLLKLRGATLDYKEGLMGAGFAINNPNTTRTCGCGSSFS
ncbi:MAG TPA: iron-sulfur cluster insertion protein ErpA [Actinobacteria bacterium]|nr:iron-sulfur cluster insertion protein ErpA [Actinomycetota bacterium]